MVDNNADEEVKQVQKKIVGRVISAGFMCAVLLVGLYFFDWAQDNGHVVSSFSEQQRHVVSRIGVSGVGAAQSAPSAETDAETTQTGAPPQVQETALDSLSSDKVIQPVAANTMRHTAEAKAAVNLSSNGASPDKADKVSGGTSVVEKKPVEQEAGRAGGAIVDVKNRVADNSVEAHVPAPPVLSRAKETHSATRGQDTRAQLSQSYFVKLPLILEMARAAALLSELKTAGIDARAEVRVTVGPFSSRESAVKAAELLQAKGYENFVVQTRQ